MASVSTYLNFPRATEPAFTFYKGIFKTEFEGPIRRFGDSPPRSGQPPLSDADRQLVMHVCLPILAGHRLMGTDAPETMGLKCVAGNNVYIHLEPDTRTETDRLFKALSEGGKVDMPLAEQFWGAYFGILVDRFGIQWMFSCAAKA